MKVTCVPYFAQYQVAMGHLVMAAKRAVSEWSGSVVGNVPWNYRLDGMDREVEELETWFKEAERLYKQSQDAGECYVYVPVNAAKKAGLI